MKDIDIEPFVGKYVELIDFEGCVHRGVLSKIISGKCNVIRMVPKSKVKKGMNTREPKLLEEFASIRNGYLLQGTNTLYDFKKSHIKKLTLVDYKETSCAEKILILRNETLRDMGV